MKNGAFAGSTDQHKWWQLPLLLPLTALALVAMGAAGAFYALSRVWSPAFLVVIVFV